MTWLPIEQLRNRLEGLDPARFVELCNSLLTEVAAANGVQRTHLSLNHRVSDPDGGIDARCIEAPVLIARILPRQNTDFQFKSGRVAKTARAIAREDILDKPRVREGLKQGHAFVLFTTWDKSDSVEGEILQALADENFTVERDQLAYFGVEALTHLLEAYPSLVCRYLWLDSVGVSDIDRWASQRAMSNQYQVDEELTARIEQLRQRIETPGSTVRVVGAAGDGKTRMVLEALTHSSLRDSVLYLPQVGDLTGALLSHLRLTRDVRCTLVIDEVLDADAGRLIDALAGRAESVRLVMVGLDASGRPQSDTLQVEGLSEDILTRTVRAIVPGLPEETARGIALDCERSPKLAVLLAGLVREDASLVGPRALKHGDVRSALDRYLKLDDAGIDWKAISTASLLMRIGWSDEAERESIALFDALGLDVGDARRAIDRLHDRYGIAPIAGRFRYVSPAILADHLAAKQLMAWPTDYLKRVFSALTPAMADSFARRVRRLSAILPNRARVEEVLLGNQGPFRKLADLESSGMSLVLHRLAAPFPWGVLQALERCVENASLEELRAAKQSRRDCVWALEEIQWREDTFERASKLLLRLSLAENETWGNNATNDWAATFQTLLGRTAAGANSRLSLVRFAASHSEEKARVLASKAIRAGFQSGHVSRMGNPPDDVEGMPAKEWFPATYGEWWDLLVGYLTILEQLIHDGSKEVRAEALDTLGEIVGDLFHLGDPVLIKWVTIAESLAGESLDVRSRLFRDLDWAIERWQQRVKDDDWDESDESDAETAEQRLQRVKDQRAGIELRLTEIGRVREMLQGKDFQSRLRVALTRRSFPIADEIEREAHMARVSQHLDELALEALATPEVLDAEWEALLLNKEWGRPEQWIEALARADHGELLGERLRTLASKHERGKLWLSLYWEVRAEARDDKGLVDRIARDLIELGDPISAFDLTLRSECTETRVERVTELLQAKVIPGNRIQQIAFSNWLSRLTVAQLLRIVRFVPKGDNFDVDLVSLIDNYLRLHPESVPALQETAMTVLESPLVRNRQPNSYEWADLAKRYVDAAPMKIGELTLRQVSAVETAHDADLSQTLKAAWDASDREEFFIQLVAPRLEDKTLDSWWARQVIHRLPISDLGHDYLLAWVREDPETRAYALAAIIGAPFGRPSNLHAMLLDEFEEFDVGSAFSADFNSGTFWGSAVDWTRGKLESARRWLDDERPAVQKWGRWMVAGLEASLQREMIRDAEEKVIR